MDRIAKLRAVDAWLLERSGPELWMLAAILAAVFALIVTAV